MQSSTNFIAQEIALPAQHVAHALVLLIHHAGIHGAAQRQPLLEQYRPCTIAGRSGGLRPPPSALGQRQYPKPILDLTP